MNIFGHKVKPGHIFEGILAMIGAAALLFTIWKIFGIDMVGFTEDKK